MIRRGSGITFLTVKLLTQHVRSTGLGDHPWPFNPGRVVADMLEVTTYQFRHPVMLFVQVEASNGLFHKVPHSIPAQRPRRVPLTAPPRLCSPLSLLRVS